MFELISDIKHMETQRLKRRYVNPDVLVIDDFANTKMTEEDALQIFKVMEYRYGFKSTIIASQLEPTEWHRNFGASQLADSILDRIVSNAYKIILSGDSLRPKKIEDYKEWCRYKIRHHFGSIFPDFGGSTLAISVAQFTPTQLALSDRRIQYYKKETIYCPHNRTQHYLLA